MNTENLEFLQSSLKYMGFAGYAPLNKELEEEMEKQSKDFQLKTKAFFSPESFIEAVLHFRRSEQLDMYFFNKYDATLNQAGDPDIERTQTFYVNKGSGVTFKEAFNLLSGRSVNKDLIDLEGQKYNAWIQLQFGEKDQHNNYKVKQYRSQYGYDLEKTLERYPIQEMANVDAKNNLLRSLKKGNQHLVNFEKLTKTEQMLIEANPQFKTINIYSNPKIKSEQNQNQQNKSDPNQKMGKEGHVSDELETHSQTKRKAGRKS